MSVDKIGSLQQPQTIEQQPRQEKIRPPFSPELVSRGNAYEALYGAEWGYLPEDHPVSQEVQALLTAYPGSDKPARVCVSLDTTSPNAFVLPNGTIVVNRALLSLVDTEELRVVIAHETMHYRLRDAEEFAKAQAAMRGHEPSARQGVALIGNMRLAEYRADIKGVIEGDEVGTHPAALRTLMQKLEKWQKDHCPGGVGLVHGREIDRIVNAGIAAQLYDFSADYQTRTPLSEAVRTFCATELPPRFPESGECEIAEAEAAFRTASALEILQCLRRWRDQDRLLAEEIGIEEIKRLEAQIYTDKLRQDPKLSKHQAELEEVKQRGIEVPVVGEGYGVALERLEHLVAEKLPTASTLQRSALVHFLFDSSATLAEDELVESPIERLTEYLGEIEDREAINDIRDILTPATLERVGVFLVDGKGIARFTGALFRSANEAGIFTEGKTFSLQPYLEESGAFFETTSKLLKERSLTGKSGFALSEPVLDELLVNIDTKASCLPAVEAVLQFQRSLTAAGLPAEATQLYNAVERQHFFKRLSEEEFSAEAKHVVAGGSDYIEEYLIEQLFGALHPLYGRVQMAKYGAYASVKLLGIPVSHFTIEDEKIEFPEVQRHMFTRKDWVRALFRSLEGEKRSFLKPDALKTKAYREGAVEQLQFSEILTSFEAVGDLCEALNRFSQEWLDGDPLNRTANGFKQILTLVIVHLLSRVGELTWLPPTQGETVQKIIHTMSRFPGPAVSATLMSEDILRECIGISPSGDRVEAAFGIVKSILNDERVGARPSEAHLAYAEGYIEEGELKNDHMVHLFTVIKEAFIHQTEYANQKPTKEVYDELVAFDRLMFRHRKVVPLPSKVDILGQGTDENFCFELLNRYVRDLDQPLDRKVLLSLVSHIYDPVVRSRIIRAVVERDLASGTLTAKEKIDLLWKNEHVRPATLGDTRERVMDEEVQTPEDIAYLRSLMAEQVEQISSPEGMGVYALLEQLEGRKDAFELFKMAYEYSEYDEKAKKEIFLILRQDWTKNTVIFSDEEALIRTESLLQNLEAADPLVKHALIRKLLIGEKGMLHDAALRKTLFEYLLGSAVDTATTSSDLVHVTREVLEVAAETVETDVLFSALSPFLQERLFLPAQKRADWHPILRSVYLNKHIADETLAGVKRVREQQVNPTQVDSDGDRVLVPVDEKIKTKVKQLGIDLESTVRSEPKPTLEVMVVRVAESLGADGARFLQVLGQYIENLSPELELAFRNAHDNVRGQPKLTASETLRRRAPALRLARMGKRLGGGSLMSPYECEVEEPTEGEPQREAIKVLAPNAEFLSDTIEASLFKLVDGLIVRDPDRYTPARQALEDISAWIRADINDTRFFELDGSFRREHSRFRVPGMRYGLYVPESRPVDGDIHAAANKYVKREEFVDGITLNRLFGDEKGHDLKQATSLIAKSFAQQLVRGVMHSDIHPGNYMLFEKDGQEWVAMIDRNYYLELDQKDQELVLGLTQEGLSVESRAETLQKYFGEDERARQQEDPFWSGLATSIEQQGQQGIHKSMARLRGIGVRIPLKLTLLLKNTSSIQRMCQRAGFASFREALGYLPEAA